MSYISRLFDVKRIFRRRAMTHDVAPSQMLGELRQLLQSGAVPEFATLQALVSSAGKNTISQIGKAAADYATSIAGARQDYEDNAATVENWAVYPGSWAPTSASNLQVSGGFLFNNSSATAAAATNRSFALSASEEMRWVGTMTFPTGLSSGYIGVGVSSVAPGNAAPAITSAGSFALTFNNSNSWMEWTDGVNVTLSTTQNANGSRVSNPVAQTGTYLVTVIVDLNHICVTAWGISGSATGVVARAKRPRAGFTVNNIWLINSDSRNLTGCSIGPLGGRKRFGTISPRTGIEGLGPTVHNGGDGTNVFTLILPTAYDSRKPVPVCICFHGNGAPHTDFEDHPYNRLCTNALLAAGYAVLSATLVSNRTSWGIPAATAAYAAAYKWAKSRFAISGVVFLGNSMGGIESLLTYYEGVIPGVAAWAAWSPTTSLANNYADPSGAGYTANIKSSYGIASDSSDYAVKTAGRDPALLSPTTWAGLPMWAMYSTDDVNVLPSANILPFLAAAAPYSGPQTVFAETGVGGHSINLSAGQPNTDLNNATTGLVAFFDKALGR